MTKSVVSLDLSATTLSLTHCAALKGSRYEYFWDYVSSLFFNLETNITETLLGMGMD